MSWLLRNCKKEGMKEAGKIGFAQNVAFLALENGTCHAT